MLPLADSARGAALGVVPVHSSRRSFCTLLVDGFECKVNVIDLFNPRAQNTVWLCVVTLSHNVGSCSYCRSQLVCVVCCVARLVRGRGVGGVVWRRFVKVNLASVEDVLLPAPRRESTNE